MLLYLIYECKAVFLGNMIGAAKPPSSQSNYVALKTVTHYPVLIGAPLEPIKLFCPKNGYTLLSSDWCPPRANHIRARAKRANRWAVHQSYSCTCQTCQSRAIRFRTGCRLQIDTESDWRSNE